MDERDIDILRYAWTKWPHVSFERLASGPGIEVTYQALTAQVDGSAPSLPTSDIVRRALDQDTLCVDVVERF